MVRNGDRASGRQVLPKAVVDDIRSGGETSAFPVASCPLLSGWRYRNRGWASNNEHGAFAARGVHGQAVYIDPKAEMVIARYASFTMPANGFKDPTSLPAHHALAKYLLANPR